MLGGPIGMRRGPGLIGAAARTAVVAGTVTAVSGAVQRRQAERAMEREEAAYATEPQPVPAQDAPAASSEISDADLSRLERLAEMKKAGVLTHEELDAEKAKVLGA